MFVALLTAVHKARATALFAFGRGIVVDIHDRMIWKTENDPAAWRNMAYNVKSAAVILQV